MQSWQHGIIERFTPTLHKSPLPPEGLAKDIRATVGCAVRTILNRELRLPNGAHGAPYIAFTTPSTEKGLFLEFTGSELKNNRQTARYPRYTGTFMRSC